MKSKISTIKKATCVLGILFIMLGLLPVGVLSRVGSVFAEDKEPTPEVVVEEPVVEEPVVEEPVVEEPVVEEPVVEEPVNSEELMTAAAKEGPDPDAEEGTTRAKLPKAPGSETNYYNGLCVKNSDICDPETPVTQPNPGGQYLESSANIVVFKVKNQYFFFEKDEGRTCDANAKFCVEFWKDGDKDMVTVYSYWQDKETCVGKKKDKVCTWSYHGPNLINFWAIDESMVLGCTDPDAKNYNENATKDDGSCYFDDDILGCTDQLANNYDPKATKDNGSCTYDVLGCTDLDANNYDELATKDDGSCTYDVEGCTDPDANNYDELATIDDGSCTFDGDDDQEGQGGGGGGAGGGIAPAGAPAAPGEAVIPVTAAGGPTEELVVIPVTGVELGVDFLALKHMFLYTGMLLFGVTLLLEGASRKMRI